MMARPPLSSVESSDNIACRTARSDLENIQESLKNSMYKRRESYGNIDKIPERQDGMESVVGRLSR